MFDSPIHDWIPGDEYLFGDPYHGKITAQKDTMATLTLPNGEQLEYPVYIFSGQGSPGLQWFRDPRATATERTPEQKKEDEKKGIEWRPDVLFDYRLKTVYRRGDWASQAGGPTCWLFSDGAACYMATMREDRATSRAQVQLVPAPIFARKPNKWFGDDELREKLTTTISADPEPAKYTSFDVVDTVRDGSRAILCSGQVQDPYGAIGWRPTPSGAVAMPPAYWFEVVIETQVDDKTGERTHTATLTQLNKGYRVEIIESNPQGPGERWFYTVVKSNEITPDGDGGSTTVITYGNEQGDGNYTMPGGALRAGANYSNRYGIQTHNGVAGYFYDEKGRPEAISFSASTISTFSASASVSGQYEDSISHTDKNGNTEIIQPGTAVTTGSGTATLVATMRHEIKGRSASTSIVMNYAATFTDFPIDDRYGSRGERGSVSWSQSLTVDGQLIKTLTGGQQYRTNWSAPGSDFFGPGLDGGTFMDGEHYLVGYQQLANNTFRSVAAKMDEQVRNPLITWAGRIHYPRGVYGEFKRYAGYLPDTYVSLNPITGEFVVSDKFVTFV